MVLKCLPILTAVTNLRKYLVKDGNATLIRKRDVFEDILRNQVI